MATRWSKKSNNNINNSAPTTLFSNVLSPRQLANKTITLGYKKLDRDSKRQRPQYNFRIHVLINNTIAKAENVLNKRTQRTNRRVMAAEEESEEDFIHMIKTNHEANRTLKTTTTTTTTINKADNHSPLRSCSSSSLAAKDQHPSLSSSSAVIVSSTSLSIKTTKDDINEDTNDHPMTEEPSCQHHHSSISIGASSLSHDCKPIVIQSVTTPIESII
ncbi:hypothetical protein BDC45DRAFT_521543 [Circinella umbellata]|nr:hypothetical protein BDC45DRAFT_521543 [Circinella umbellata]